MAPPGWWSSGICSRRSILFLLLSLHDPAQSWTMTEVRGWGKRVTTPRHHVEAAPVHRHATRGPSRKLKWRRGQVAQVVLAVRSLLRLSCLRLGDAARTSIDAAKFLESGCPYLSCPYVWHHWQSCFRHCSRIRHLLSGLGGSRQRVKRTSLVDFMLCAANRRLSVSTVVCIVGSWENVIDKPGNRVPCSVFVRDVLSVRSCRRETCLRCRVVFSPGVVWFFSYEPTCRFLFYSYRSGGLFS